jgi:hypothetical protein
MSNNQREGTSYRKKYKKELHHYLAMLLLCDTFDLPKDAKDLLFEILDERTPETWEWEKMVERSRRIRAIFSEHPFYSFGTEYPIALRAAFGKIEIMSN